MQLRKKPEKKIQYFNGIRTRDLAITVRCSNQLSYEDTDVGSWSIFLGVCSYVPVKKINEINHTRTAKMKSNKNDSPAVVNAIYAIA